MSSSDSAPKMSAAIPSDSAPTPLAAGSAPKPPAGNRRRRTTLSPGVSRMLSSDGDDYEEEVQYVINRAGRREPINFGQVSDRIRTLCSPAYGNRLRGIDHLKLQQGVIPRVASGMTTREIDDILVEVCRGRTQDHPDYATLAARLTVSNLQKSIPGTFADVYISLYEEHGRKSRLAPSFIELLRNEDVARQIEDTIDYRRDFDNTSFSIATLVRSYLMRDPVTRETKELPQHAYMRVALQIHCTLPLEDEFDMGLRVGEHTGSTYITDPDLLGIRLEDAFATYHFLSRKHGSHATPTVINAGTPVSQMSSCFQMRVNDALKGLYRVVMDAAMMSKTAGGVSIDLTEMRSAGTLIASSGGTSSGIERYMRVQQESQGYANQGGTRPGAFAMYLAPWHADIFTFLELALPRGPRHERREDACKLKYAMWVSDRFLRALVAEIDNEEKVAAGGELTEEEAAAAKWYLMSPDECPGLQDVYDERSIDHPDGPGGQFSLLYDRYVSEGKYRQVVKPSDIIQAACLAISQRGYPYVLSKDNVNRQSNLVHQVQRTREEVMSPGFSGRELCRTNMTVKSSNLCAEVTIPCRYIEGEYRSALYSVCNLAAVNVMRFVESDRSTARGVRMDWAGLISAAGILTNNLDRIIDVNFTDLEACRRSNQHFRAIGIGIIGLADAFAMSGLAFGDPEAMALDAAIHACIYFGAMHQSACLARQRGSFPAFDTSRSAQGVLQPDMCVEAGALDPEWEQVIMHATDGALTPARWADLRELVKGGLRNGYVTALMPTATSSNAMGANECFEPYTALLYTRKTLAGEYTIFNTHLQRELQSMKMWDRTVSAHLEMDAGSVASWDGTNGKPRLSERMRRVYRTAREIDPLELVAHSVARNPFVSQSQSLNSFRDYVSVSELLEIWLTGWRSGLGTLSYYVHTKVAGGSLKTAAIGVLGKSPAAAGKDGAAGKGAASAAEDIDPSIGRPIFGGATPRPTPAAGTSCPLDPVERAACAGCSV